MSPPDNTMAFPLLSTAEVGDSSLAGIEGGSAAGPPMRLSENLTQAPVRSAEAGNHTAASGSVTTPEIVPADIRNHIRLIHLLAASLRGQAKVVATVFGEDPHQIDPKTGKSGLPLKPRII